MKTSITLALLFSALTLFAQDNTGKGVGVPEELTATLFADTDISPSPACIGVSAEGEVYIGVDMNGSLGKGPGKGKIIRGIDQDHDGKMDSHTVYAEIDNPRGLIPIGDKLWVLHTVIPKSTGKLEAMHLSLLTDANRDGVADGPPKILLSDVSPPKHNQARGADHTTNGIQIGIDGWIYIAVGDFGMHGTTGTDGTVLTMLGGGIVRLRPDGTEMEVYTHGLRNIYDMAIDPKMNVYTRGNTNDGGGWNVRFIHQIQSGEYGYPMLFKHFTDEIIPALQDLGGGSGTGALYLSEPGWPEKYNNQPLMCDWGRSQLIIHRLTPDGPSFTQEPENFVKLHQIADLDVDASGRIYMAAWNGAGYKGSPSKGYTVRVTPKGWTYKAFPDVKKLSSPELVKLLLTDSAKSRQRAQQELVARKDVRAFDTLMKIAASSKVGIDSRIAAIFTAKQLKGAEATDALVALAKDASVREWALRALADRRTQNAKVPMEPFLAGLKDPNPRVQVAAAVGLGRLGRAEAAPALLAAASSIPEPQAAGAASGPRFQSPLTKKLNRMAIDVDITGMKQLVLAVLGGGDGNGNDHAAWFDPVVVTKDGKSIPLTDHKWKSAKQGWGKTQLNKDCTGKPLSGKEAKGVTSFIGTHADSFIVYDMDPSWVRFKSKAGGTGGSGGKVSVMFAVNDSVNGFKATGGKEGPHATPNSPILVPHVAVQALRQLDATPTLVSALQGPHRYAALWAMKYTHNSEAVNGLIAAHSGSSDAAFRGEALETLLRLAKKELPYDGSWWWGTRPDTHGPYYKTGDWEGSATINAHVKTTFDAAGANEAGVIVAEMARHRVEIKGIDTTAAASKPKEKKVDLTKVDKSKGEVGKTSIEDLMLALDDAKPDHKLGKTLFTRQGCVACHTLSTDQKLKGPFMGHVGNILSKEQIAESILKPNASISQGFATMLITMKDGKAYTGFISAQTGDETEIRDIAGNVSKVKNDDIKKTHELEVSMMPPGLADALSVKEFTALVNFLSSMKK